MSPPQKISPARTRARRGGGERQRAAGEAERLKFAARIFVKKNLGFNQKAPQKLTDVFYNSVNKPGIGGMTNPTIKILQKIAKALKFKLMIY